MNDDIIRPKIDLRQQPTIVCEECGSKFFKEISKGYFWVFIGMFLISLVRNST